MTKVLVVDYATDSACPLHMWLEEDGYEVYSSADRGGALRLFYEHKPALGITDLRLPGMDGFRLISRIREMSDVPILAHTTQGSEENVVHGLELGADEYLVKPVTRKVFLAQVGSLLRRKLPAGTTPDVYSDASLTLKFLTHEVQVRGESVHLRPTEFRLLCFFVRNGDRVVSHQELLDRVWGDWGGSIDSLKWYISSLREKVEEDPRHHRIILTVPRVGYRYNTPPGSEQATAC